MAQAEAAASNFRNQLEGVRYSNDAVLDRNYSLKEELDSLNQHASLLGDQNVEL